MEYSKENTFNSKNMTYHFNQFSPNIHPICLIPSSHLNGRYFYVFFDQMRINRKCFFFLVKSIHVVATIPKFAFVLKQEKKIHNVFSTFIASFFSYSVGKRNCPLCSRRNQVHRLFKKNDTVFRRFKLFHQFFL